MIIATIKNNFIGDNVAQKSIDTDWDKIMNMITDDSDITREEWRYPKTPRQPNQQSAAVSLIRNELLRMS